METPQERKDREQAETDLLLSCQDLGKREKDGIFRAGPYALGAFLRCLLACTDDLWQMVFEASIIC